MLDALLKLLEKLIELVKLRKEAEERAVDHLVTPIFTDLKAIHEDYLSFLEACRRSLSEGVDIAEIAKQLMSDRLEQEALRRSIRAFVQSYQMNSRLSRYASFFREVHIYLQGHDLGGHSSAGEGILKALEDGIREEQKNKLLLHADMRQPGLRQALIQLTGWSLENLRKRWSSVCHEYAIIVANSVTK